MYNFQSITRKDWVTDYGFRKALAANPGTMKFGGQTVGAGRKDVVEYWQREKSSYPLWELLLSMGSHTAPQTLAYFDLPADTVEFVRWVYNEVSHEERERVAEMVQGFASGFDQMNFFPYAALYAIWQRADERQARDGNVLVYLDRITEPDGQELVRLTAPTFFE
ncbi:hypothetical protein [Hymenobacter sp. PAMC 26628]|uniref:hypothetical protein n=1 Tax=Hymenobacter sp. PAMC 26628 TaxID=1484118 RepID=UPI0007702974|nr:hypothetical protein [Hymenobacter sp. PAMC 26628]AMJ64029.1 hypothetical protein AXW84_00240 [Hymenobacter sp. PAMC 26628]